MMTLIFMGISVAYFYSLYAFVANQYVHSTVERMDFFWELASSDRDYASGALDRDACGR